MLCNMTQYLHSSLQITALQSSFKQAHEGRKLTDPIPLTAYVLIALYKLEAVSGVSPEISSCFLSIAVIKF